MDTINFVSLAARLAPCFSIDSFILLSADFAVIRSTDRKLIRRYRMKSFFYNKVYDAGVFFFLSTIFFIDSFIAFGKIKK